jgi:hypothetical protein
MRGPCRQNSPGTAKRRGERGRLEHPSPDGRERRDVFPSKYRVPSLRSSPQTKHQRYRSSCRDDRGDRMIVSASKGGLGPVRDCTHLQWPDVSPKRRVSRRARARETAQGQKGKGAFVCFAHTSPRKRPFRFRPTPVIATTPTQSELGQIPSSRIMRENVAGRPVSRPTACVAPTAGVASWMKAPRRVGAAGSTSGIPRWR